VSELGNVLKKAREEKGYSLEDIQDLTKIRKRYLEALESGDYSVLPGKFYIRAFIKNYADCVGLDAEEVLNYYQGEVPDTAPTMDESVPTRKPQRIRMSSSEKFGKFGITILMWCFLILIVVVLWYYMFNREAKEPNQIDNTPVSNNSEQVNPNPSTTPSVTPTDSNTVTPPPVKTPPPLELTFVEKVGQDEIYSVSPAKEEGYDVTITVKGGASWLAVYDGGKKGERVYYANAKDGDVLTYTMKQDMYFIIGRPDYLELKIENTIVPDGDLPEKTKRFLIKPEVFKAEESDSTTQ